MRSTLTRSLSIALALVLTAMLAPTGLSEAKGGKSVLWQAAIPTSLDGRNLAGFSGSPAGEYAVFQDEGFRGSIRVDVSSSKVRGSSFTLMFLPGTAEEGYGVSIEGVAFATHLVTDGEVPCQFGTECGSGPSDCLECLINGVHPYSGYSPGYGFALHVATDENIESQSLAGGRLFLFLDDYGDPYDQYHSVVCRSPRNAVTIERLSADEWKLYNGFNGENTLLECEEYYLEPAVGTGKGNSGRVKTVTRTVMTAEMNDAFVFETIFARK